MRNWSPNGAVTRHKEGMQWLQAKVRELLAKALDVSVRAEVVSEHLLEKRRSGVPSLLHCTQRSFFRPCLTFSEDTVLWFQPSTFILIPGQHLSFSISYSCDTEGEWVGKEMKPWTTTTKKKRCRDSKNTSLGLVMRFKDCLHQWAKVLPRKAIFCWVKVKRKKQRMRKKLLRVTT